MVKAVIFDVDGTLVDSVDSHAQSWQDTFRHFGYAFDFEDIRSQIGKGGDQLMPMFLSDEEIEHQGKQIEAYRSTLVKDRFFPKIVGFPQVRELMENLISRHIDIVLASSAKKDELGFYKRVSGIEDLVQKETTSDDADASKPHPDIFEAAIALLPGISKDEIIVVGDTPYDAEAAGKAGLRTIGVLCGGFTEQDLKNPADRLAKLDQWHWVNLIHRAIQTGDRLMVARRAHQAEAAPARKPAPNSEQVIEFPLPRETPPMEAKSAERLPEAAGAWQYEPKWDGFRCLAFKAGSTVDLRAKSGKPLGRYFPEVVSMLATLAAERFVLDGELVIEIDGRLAFDALQMRLHPAESRIRKLSAETPARVVIFDTLGAPDGAVVMDRPLQQRRHRDDSKDVRPLPCHLRFIRGRGLVARCGSWRDGRRGCKATRAPLRSR